MSQAAQDLSAVVTRLDGRIEPGAATLSTAASTERPAAQIIELPVVAGPDEAPAKIEVAVVDAPADLVETVEVTEIVDAVETPVAEPVTEVAEVEAAPEPVAPAVEATLIELSEDPIEVPEAADEDETTAVGVLPAADALTAIDAEELSADEPEVPADLVASDDEAPVDAGSERGKEESGERVGEDVKSE